MQDGKKRRKSSKYNGVNHMCRLPFVTEVEDKKIDSGKAPNVAADTSVSDIWALINAV